MGGIVRQQNFYIGSQSGSFALDATGGNMIVFVGCAGKSTNSPSYINVCTYNAVSLSLRTSHRVNRASCDIWVMPTPPTGSNTLAYSGSGLTMAGTAFVMAGMAVADYELDEGTVPPTSDSLITNAGGYCFSGYSSFNTYDMSLNGTNGTIETQEIYNASHGSNHWCGYLQAVTNPDTISMSGAAGSYQAWAAVSIAAAGTGNQVIMIASKIQELYKDMKIGRKPADELLRRYRDLMNLAKPLEVGA